MFVRTVCVSVAFPSRVISSETGVGPHSADTS